MRTLTSLCVATLASGCAFAVIGCENPPMVAIPDGKSSTMDQLLAAQTQIKSYMAAMEQYLACINNELDSEGDAAPMEFKALLVTRHDAGVDEMQTVANAFNEQIRAYKAANPSPPK